MDESARVDALARLFEWVKQKYPELDSEAVLDKALADVDEFAQGRNESPEALRTLIRAAMKSSAKRLEFPPRRLRLGSEPVTAAELRMGAVYYQVQFHHSNPLIPQLLPYAFAGFGLGGEGDDAAYFQDVDSYAEGVRFGDDGSGEEAEFLRLVRPINGLYTFDVALEALMKVWLERERLMQRSYQKLRLESGATVEVKTHTYIGREMCELNYFTLLSTEDSEALRTEMLEVWKHHSRSEENDKREFRAVTAHKKPEFVDQVLPNPVTLAFRREGASWVEAAWNYGDEV